MVTNSYSFALITAAVAGVSVIACLQILISLYKIKNRQTRRVKGNYTIIEFLLQYEMIKPTFILFTLFFLKNLPCLPSSASEPVSCMVIFGSGGHTTEMLSIINKLEAQKYNPIYFVVAQVSNTYILNTL